MKKVLFILLAACVMMGASAQDNGNKKFEDRIEKISKKLKLNVEQESKFVPIYADYHKELQNLMSEMRKNGNSGQDRQARMEAMKQAVKVVRDKYNAQFATVLSAEQITELYKIEEEMQAQMRKNHNGRMGQGRPGGNGQRRGNRDGSFHNGGMMKSGNF